MNKVRSAVSILAISAAALAVTAGGAGAADAGARSRPCTVAGAFCATFDGTSRTVTLLCGWASPLPAHGGGYWNNRLPGNGVVRMAKGTQVIYNTPPNYGPVRGNWAGITTVRADCG
ncbi:hypothetical protein [Amycolatopsis alba]|uniref:hypothetical protein n=1 Tax=Amycolatopsis alba TaxID=76020 RepID=UPI000365ED99|nr:hypothetical protein [Amycolatopsis alba]